MLIKARVGQVNYFPFLTLTGPERNIYLSGGVFFIKTEQEVTEVWVNIMFLSLNASFDIYDTAHEEKLF